MNFFAEGAKQRDIIDCQEEEDLVFWRRNNLLEAKDYHAAKLPRYMKYKIRVMI